MQKAQKPLYGEHIEADYGGTMTAAAGADDDFVIRLLSPLHGWRYACETRNNRRSAAATKGRGRRCAYPISLSPHVPMYNGIINFHLLYYFPKLLPHFYAFLYLPQLTNYSAIV